MTERRYDLIPVADMAFKMQRYIEDGIQPGSFLAAILCNDFMDAANCADVENRKYLFEWAAWLYNYAPSGCHGSKEQYFAWMKDIAAARAAEAEINRP